MGKLWKINPSFKTTKNETKKFVLPALEFGINAMLTFQINKLAPLVVIIIVANLSTRGVWERSAPSPQISSVADFYDHYKLNWENKVIVVNSYNAL